MSSPALSKLPPKRPRQPGQDQESLRSHRKRRKLDRSASTYWDSLSKIWLTKDALEELCRRNNIQEETHSRSYKRRQNLSTRAPRPKLKERFVTDPLRGSSAEYINAVKKTTRSGGPDISDLRNYQVMTSDHSGSRSRKRRAESPSPNVEITRTTAKTTTTTVYNRNFQQHLTDHGIYQPEYRYPGSQKKLPKPDNFTELSELLSRPHASLSAFSEEQFEKFREADGNVSKERPVTTYVIPVIEGDVGDHRCLGGDYIFGNLAHLTNGTLARAKPDHLYGARPEQLDRQIRDELSNQIIPSTQGDLPMLPNFFLEVKGPDGSPTVVTRSACYDGALGARGMQHIQSYKQDMLIYDNNARTITSTYIAGTLKLYAHHIIPPESEDGRHEFIMTQIKGYSMTGDHETFIRGASAYRNARDWAKEQRDNFIAVANERYAKALCLSKSTSERETASEFTATMGDVETSITSDEVEFHDAAQLSFADPVSDNVESSPVDRDPKKARIDESSKAERSGKSLPN